MKRSLQDLAQFLEASLIGDGAVSITGIASLQSAGPGDLVFVEEKKPQLGIVVESIGGNCWRVRRERQLREAGSDCESTAARLFTGWGLASRRESRDESDAPYRGD